MNYNSFDPQEPTTYAITFDGGNKPKLFNVYDSEGNLYYFRHLDGKTGSIELNFPDNGHFTTDDTTPFTITASKPLVPSGQDIPLPPPDRSYDASNLKIQVGPPSMGSTPARIFPKIGVIEYNPNMTKYPYPIRLFILLHELSHTQYTNEASADAMALKLYLGMGYNASMAYYSLSHILKVSPDNVVRLKKMFSNIMNYS
jgi:hypothetical protein